MPNTENIPPKDSLLPWYEFSKLSAERCSTSFGIPINGNSFYFTNMLAEEVGEVCGALKKLTRPYTKRDEEKIIKYLSKTFGKTPEEISIEYSPEELQYAHQGKYRNELVGELADVFMALDLLASNLEMDLPTAVGLKFTEVCRQLNFKPELGNIVLKQN